MISNDKPVTEFEETPNIIAEFLNGIYRMCFDNANKTGNGISSYYLPNLEKKYKKAIKILSFVDWNCEIEV